MWAITVRAPVSRLDAKGAVNQFARSLLDRPPRRAANVVEFELFAAEWDDSAEFAQYVLLLLTVDSGGKPHLEKLVEELDEHLPETFDVSGVELSVVEKSAAASR
jgi:hypothetical protein